MRRVRQIERFSDECHEIQLQQLTQLLDEAKNTEYGRKHGFARLQDINDFKKAVPLSLPPRGKNKFTTIFQY